MIYIILLIVATLFLLIHIACFTTSIFVDKNREKLSRNKKIIKRLFSIIFLVISALLIMTICILFATTLDILDPTLVDIIQKALTICPSISIALNIIGSGISFA